MENKYTTDFYANRQRQTRVSAEKVIGLIYSKITPCTVVDFGCATGTWLAECKRRGAEAIRGIDGGWVDMRLLEIDKEEFSSHDLGKNKYQSADKYDLAICIEVAEHLSPEMGDQLIDSLANSSDVILFSAAIKGQGGTGHLNEQPQHYWAERFQARGYACIDFIRPKIWTDRSVNVIYKQNMLLYVNHKILDNYKINAPLVAEEYELDRIHPDLFAMRAKPGNVWALIRWIISIVRARLPFK